ncbi:MAG: polymer-forming cytoskeletal protein [Candidatus Omnitrophota bacterium]
MALKRRGEEKILDVDASMQGSLIFKDPVNLRINGKFEGKLEVRGTLTIGSSATVTADITGDNIIIGGKVRGKIITKSMLVLLSTAIVEAEIYPVKLSVAEGAIFEGRCHMLHELLTSEELARYLEVDLSSIAEWVSSGKIAGIKDGDSWKFERRNIDSWIASGKIR